MWLNNTETNDIRILPTDRLIKKLDHFDEAAIMKKFEKNFKITPVADPGDMHEFILGKAWTFGIIFKENADAVRLVPEAFPALKWNFPDEAICGSLLLPIEQAEKRIYFPLWLCCDSL